MDVPVGRVVYTPMLSPGRRVQGRPDDHAAGRRPLPRGHRRRSRHGRHASGSPTTCRPTASAQLVDLTTRLVARSGCGARAPATSWPPSRPTTCRTRASRSAPAATIEVGTAARARLAHLLRRRPRLGALRPAGAGPAAVGHALGGRRSRTASSRSASASTAPPAGSRRATAPMGPSWRASTTWSRRACAGPRSRTHDFVGKEALPAAPRGRPGRRPVHADGRRPHVEHRREALPAGPRADPHPRRRADHRCARPPLVRHQRRLGARRLGSYVLMAYLPPRARERRRPSSRSSTSASSTRSRSPAPAPLRCSTPRTLRIRSVNILVCVKRVPMTGGKIVLTDDAQVARHRAPRLHDQPARGVRGRGGGAAGRGERRRRLRC